MVKKVIRCLPKVWEPKVMVIQEAKDQNTVSLDALMGSLKINEIELIEANENMSQKVKAIALNPSWS